MGTGQMVMLGFTLVTGGVTLLAGIAALHDYIASFAIHKMHKDGIPIRIRRSIRYGQFEKAMQRMATILDETRFKPDLILGVHYQGTAFAAVLGKMLYVPIMPVIVKYEDNAGTHRCERVRFPFNPNQYLRGKKVLILDNSMRSGKTMQMTREEVQKYTGAIKTMVVIQKYGSADPFIQPDYVLFRASKPIRFLR